LPFFALYLSTLKSIEQASKEESSSGSGKERRKKIK
jgi:hypothetical protein